MAEGLNLVFGVLAILAIVAIVLVVTALAIGALLRDKHGTSGSLSTAALNVQSLLQPEKKKVVETMQSMEERAESDESGPV